MEDAMDDKALLVIKLFLINRGFDAAKAQEGVQDGHWILLVLPLLCAACCRDSYEAGLRNILLKLEQGCHYDGSPLVSGESDWKQEDTEKVLKLAQMEAK